MKSEWEFKYYIDIADSFKRVITSEDDAQLQQQDSPLSTDKKRISNFLTDELFPAIEHEEYAVTEEESDRNVIV